LIEQYLGRLGCYGGDCGEGTVSANGSPLNVQLPSGESGLAGVAEDFFRRALMEDLSPAEVFRITITSFLDAYNFDVRRVMKCCIHHVLPSGHVVPFCAYNVLYREGHVKLPPLRDGVAVDAPVSLPLVSALVSVHSHR
jgi:7,8-dihydro-6-hydroxymethylpterin dimethyltransferase